MTSIKTIHSRSNKDIGDVIEGEWEITAKRVIAEPRPGDGNGSLLVSESTNTRSRRSSVRAAVKPGRSEAAEPAERRRDTARSVIGSAHRAKNVLTELKGRRYFCACSAARRR